MIFATVADGPPGEVQVAWPFGRRSSAGCTLRTQYVSIGDAGAYAVFMSCSTWQWGARHGVNEHGVAIAGGRVDAPGVAAGDRPGLIGADLVRLGLERARSAEEAVGAMAGLLESCGLGGGDGVSGEGSDDPRFVVADPRQVLVLRTDGADGADGVPGAVRLEPLRTGGRGTTPSSAASELRERERPEGAGSRAPAASMIAELPGAIAEGAPVRVYVAPGSPATSIFVPAFPRTVAGPPPYIPVELSGEELWHAADQLRAAVEDRPDAMAEVRAALGPVEQELWGDADEVFDDPARWAAAGASWGSRALHALRSCIPSSG